jgi:hypothetical protein
MLCERCGEIAETFMTEDFGELCETCQRAAEQEKQRAPIQRLPRASEDG